jgi:hypothetical protein
VLEYRPVAQPHMGGHIERLLGTLMGALHELPGATFVRSKRGTYDSDATAVMTLREIDSPPVINVLKIPFRVLLPNTKSKTGSRYSP